ncbi:hypothetical protein C8T65DRAFT_650872 [Cerioporus squamosus]|nr:hypothetical protein C8T65DRAFT_650872 [Cerioporus squamosus]
MRVTWRRTVIRRTRRGDWRLKWAGTACTDFSFSARVARIILTHQRVGCDITRERKTHGEPSLALGPNDPKRTSATSSAKSHRLGRGSCDSPHPQRHTAESRPIAQLSSRDKSNSHRPRSFSGMSDRWEARQRRMTVLDDVRSPAVLVDLPASCSPRSER